MSASGLGCLSSKFCGPSVATLRSKAASPANGAGKMPRGNVVGVVDVVLSKALEKPRVVDVVGSPIP